MRSWALKRSMPEWCTGIPESNIVPTGNEVMHRVSVQQTIPVLWNRPGDGMELSSGFEITVTYA